MQARASPASRLPLLRRRWVRVALLLAVAIALAFGNRASWLTWMGELLIKSDPLAKADIVVVLAGDLYGERILLAAELVEKGYAPRVLVSGPKNYFGVPEHELAIPFAVARGAAEEIFDGFPIEAHSTREETHQLDRELRRRGIGKALVVTSNFHTRRARYIFHKHGSKDVDYVFVAADYPDFRPEDWWRSRQGRKVFVLESLKTLHSWFE